MSRPASPEHTLFRLHSASRMVSSLEGKGLFAASGRRVKSTWMHTDVAFPGDLLGRRSAPRDTMKTAISSPSGIGSQASVSLPGTPSTTTKTVDLKTVDREVSLCDENTLLLHEFNRHSSNGLLTIDDLPLVFKKIDVHADAADLRAALGACTNDIVESGGLTYEEVLEVLRKVRLNVSSSPQELPQAAQIHEGGTAQKHGVWSKCARFLSAMNLLKSDGNVFSNLTPTNRLFAAIMVLSSVSALVLALTSVNFFWAEHISDIELALAQETATVKECISRFAVDGFVDSFQASLGSTTQLLGQIVGEIGYKEILAHQASDLSLAQQLLGKSLSSTFQFFASNVVEVGASSYGWIENLFYMLGEKATVQLVNSMNRDAEHGTEIVLGRWNDSRNTSIKFLTDFSFRDECLAACGSSATAAAPMKAALTGATGSLIGNDYRPHPVYAGYAYLPKIQVGLVYKVDVEVLQQRFNTMLRQVIDAMNRQRNDTVEVVLGERSPAGSNVNQPKFLSQLRFCDESCQASTDEWSAVPMRRALTNEVGVMVGADYRNEPVIAAFGPIEGLQLGLVVKVDKKEVVGAVRTSLVASVNEINKKMNGTEELLLVSNAADEEPQYLTEFRFEQECPGQCSTTMAALSGCRGGSKQDIDYRNKAITIGYSCIPELDVSLGYKVDTQQINEWGLQAAIDYVNDRNRREDTTRELILARHNAGVAPENVTSPKDFTFLTDFKHKDECGRGECGRGGAAAAPMVSALQGRRGITFGKDYRPKDVIAAHDYIEAPRVGLVSKIDIDESNAPVVSAALKLGLICVGLVLAGAVAMACVMKTMLRALERVWAEGKAVVEREKQQFSSLVKALYPEEVAGRLLDGETQISYRIPDASVFFSDIFRFTDTAARLSFEELLDFLGYTFGVMDTIAEHFGVYKVKTIGDSYLAFTGLRGAGSGRAWLDMLYFASTCAQVFSDRFHHPDRGAVVALLAARSVTDARKWPHFKKAPGSGRKYRAPAAGRAAALWSPQCVMRYGVAMGPLTAGVLQGKNPQFDIWGSTVNLASRMESTGAPGRIQVTQSVYDAAQRHDALPFIFSASHKTYCKGFGEVQAYYVEASAHPPPDALLQKLHLRPNYGLFYFDSIKAEPGRRSASGRSADPLGSVTHDQSGSVTHDKSSGYRPSSAVAQSSLSTPSKLPTPTLAAAQLPWAPLKIMRSPSSLSVLSGIAGPRPCDNESGNDSGAASTAPAASHSHSGAASSRSSILRQCTSSTITRQPTSSSIPRQPTTFWECNQED